MQNRDRKKKIIFSGIYGGWSSRSPWEPSSPGAWLAAAFHPRTHPHRVLPSGKEVTGRPFSSHRICRYGSFLTGAGGVRVLVRVRFWPSRVPHPGQKFASSRELLPAVMTELGDFRRLFLDRRFVEQRFLGFFMDLRPPGRFGSFPHFGFYDRAPHHMFGNIPSWRADLRLCQGFHGTFHGNLHGRLDFGFFHGRDIITGCPGLSPIQAHRQREPFLRIP